MSVEIESIKTEIAELRQEIEQLKISIVDSFEKIFGRIVTAVEKLEEMHK